MLSKSDFQLASSCTQKLLYKKRGYPTGNDTNEYMKMLAQGGYIIGHMATMKYQDGVEITGNTAQALAATRQALEQENCILFEAAIESNQKIIRIDILIKEGRDRSLKIIEVKSKSHDSEDDVEKQNKELKKYIQDVAYQYFVLAEAYPEMKIECFLLMPDKSKRTGIEGFAGWFSIENDPDENDIENENLPAQQRPRFRKPVVRFLYENHPERLVQINRLLEDDILTLRPVTEQVLKEQERIMAAANVFINVLNNNSAEGTYCINKNCKSCEFRTPDNDQNGFGECWGEMATEDPHIFDLYFGGGIGSAKKGYYLDELIQQNKASLKDIDKNRLTNVNGELGSRATRQLIQLEYTIRNEEWKSNELKPLIQNFKYPLHFIDFETHIGAVPFHSNMRPYELLAFQWSVHTIEREGAVPVHQEWLHENAEFPNFEFAIALMNAIGETGTPFMWATHENTVLRTILNQMEVYEYHNPNLKNWLLKMTHDNGEARVGRLIDMNKITFDYYFHPKMKGRTSIKKVLPAIWETHNYLHSIEHFAEYRNFDASGNILDPYDTLTVHGDEETGDEVVKEGTAAMRAYFRYRFDQTLTENQKQEIKNQLKAYCKLDTLSMVIIAHHWCR